MQDIFRTFILEKLESRIKNIVIEDTGEGENAFRGNKVWLDLVNFSNLSSYKINPSDSCIGFSIKGIRNSRSGFIKIYNTLYGPIILGKDLKKFRDAFFPIPLFDNQPFNLIESTLKTEKGLSLDLTLYLDGKPYFLRLTNRGITTFSYEHDDIAIALKYPLGRSGYYLSNYIDIDYISSWDASYQSDTD